MPKCPYCKRELEHIEGEKYYCENCNRYFRPQRSAPQATPKAEETQPPQTEQSQPVQQPEPQTDQATDPQPESQNPIRHCEEQSDAAIQTQQSDNELELLKTRLALVEAEKQLAEKNLQLAKQRSQKEQRSAQSGVFKEKVSGFFTKVAATPAWARCKKHWYIAIASVLGLIIFITLMVTLVGIRGIYVNIYNPNEFYSFTATDYEYHGISMFGGGDYVDKGTWRKSGNKLLLTYKDEDFGKITEENVILKNDGNKLLVLEDEFGMQKTFKRVNIVNYSAVATKVKVTFDANGGLVNNSNKSVAKIKIGSKLQAPTPSKQDCQFMGWYTEPYGYKSGNAQMYDQRTSIWENITYYANWYNPNDYEITLTGEASGTLIAKEGDNLLSLLQSKYEDCEFTFNNKIIDSKFTMPAQNIKVKCSFSEAYWQQLEAIFEFGYSSGNGYYVSCKNTNISGDIDIPSNYRGSTVDEIGSFANCTKITSITIPETITNVNAYAGIFSGCTSLERITVSPNNKTYHSESNCVINTESKTLVVGCKASVIPTDGSVTSIGNSAFEGCTGLTSIVIPDSVTDIDYDAFYGCDNITTATMPTTTISSIPKSSLQTVIITSGTSIGDWAFEGCSGLTSIVIPDSVTSIGSNAFYNTAWYNNQPDGLVYAGKVAYQYKGTMPSNTSITIKDGTKSINASAFRGCSELTSIVIPDSVTSIGNGAFSGTAWYNNQPDGLVYAGKVVYKYKGTMPSNTSITIKDGTKGIAASAFSDCSGLTSIVIPDSVTSIGSSAFSGCSGLTSITIPDSVTSIGYDAFRGCSGLTSITVSSNNAKYASQDGILYNKEKTEFIHIPKAIQGAVTIPDSVTSIGEYAFYYCSNLTNITIPDSVTSIGSSAFSGCSGLTSITVNSGNIKYHSDGNCLIETASKTLIAGCKASVIPTDGSVTSIGSSAFYGCTGLTSIVIPDSVTSIGYWAFEGCSGLTSITVSPNNATYASQDGILYNKEKTKFIHIPKAIQGAVTIPDGVTSIGSYAFSDCSRLTSIVIPDSVTSIGYWAFEGCSGLTSIVIPDSVTDIDYSFWYCSGLTSITFQGTKAQWATISKYPGWNANTGNFTIHCTDGDLDKNGNEI